MRHLRLLAPLIAATLLVGCTIYLPADLGISAKGKESPRDCREVTGKGETASSWFLMTPDGGLLFVDKNQYQVVTIGQTVCGEWKDKGEPKVERKVLPEVDCETPIPASDQRCPHISKT